MIHEVKNESQWVFGSGVHPDERYDALIFEATIC